MTKGQDVVVSGEDNFEPATDVASVQTEQDIVIGQGDIEELMKLEQEIKSTGDQLDKLSGAITRMTADQQLYVSHERNLAGQMDAKRKDVMKRYKIDEKRNWQIDVNTRKIVYSS